MTHTNGTTFRNVTSAHPCPKCGKPDWCSVAEDGLACCCRRVAEGGEPRTDAGGAPYYVHRFGPSTNGHTSAAPRFSLADGNGEKADADTLNKVYSTLLDALSLDVHHVDRLRARGLKGDLRAAGYRSLGRGRVRAVQTLVAGGLEGLQPHVPGFFVRKGKSGSFWSLAGASGLLIPIRDAEARIVALMVRADFVEGKRPRYSFVSSKKHGGAGPGAPVHHPLFTGDRTTVRVTEGCLKADVATELGGVLTLGLAGVSGLRRLVPLLRGLKAATVRVAFDADASRNIVVATALDKLVRGLKAEDFAVQLERWSEGDGKGIDDLLAAGKTPDLVTGADVLTAIEEITAAARAVSPAAPPVASPDRPAIVITTEEHEVAAQALAALATDPTVYQRVGALVRVVRDTSPAAKGIRRPFASRIEALPQPILRERLAERARWYGARRGSEGEEHYPARPPVWCVQAVHARGEWGAVPHLEAVVEYPVMRPDGSLLMTPGYDPDTGLILDVRGEMPTLPERPTRDDAVRAADALLDVVSDFPFVGLADRAAWLAALLTPLARFGFVGPAPLFLADANVRGAGKGLLLGAIARVVTGEDFTIATYTQDDDELRKRITALALSGDRMVLFDNLTGKFGCPSLDAALTGTSWKDRVLGVNRMAEAPLYMTWYATGNNVAIAADTCRRTCPIRLETDMERPEERAGFRVPDLLAHVAAHRVQLLGAALTILRAFHVAGRPGQGLTSWGSYEGWSGLVRAAVVWAGLPDPAETRLRLEEQSDTAADGMRVLLSCWQRMDPDHRGLTAAEVVARLDEKQTLEAPEWYADMRAAIEGVAGKVDGRALGNTLRGYRRRNFGGLFIDRAGKAKRAVRWAVYPATAFRDAPKGECGE